MPSTKRLRLYNKHSFFIRHLGVPNDIFSKNNNLATITLQYQESKKFIMYRMTYNNKGITGCSARGIARRETKEELLELAEVLKDTICNIDIKPVDSENQIRQPEKNDGEKLKAQ